MTAKLTKLELRRLEKSVRRQVGRAVSSDEILNLRFKDGIEVAEIEALDHATKQFAKVLAKRPEVRSVAILKVALWAFQRGWFLSERIYREYLFADRLRAGGRVILGGVKGAVARHGSDLGKDRQQAARKKYSEYAARFADLNRTTLCGMVAEDYDVSPSTVAAWVPNPQPTRRGRPRKK